MRTTCLLTVSQHALLGGVPTRGCTCPGGWAGGCTCRGVPAWGFLPGGIPVGGERCTYQGVYLPGGCTCPGGIPSQVLPPPMDRILDTRFSKFYLWGEGCTCQGVYLPGGCTFPGTPPMDRILDTRFSKFYLAPTSLWVVKIQL